VFRAVSCPFGTVIRSGHYAERATHERAGASPSSTSDELAQGFAHAHPREHDVLDELHDVVEQQRDERDERDR